MTPLELARDRLVVWLLVGSLLGRFPRAYRLCAILFRSPAEFRRPIIFLRALLSSFYGGNLKNVISSWSSMSASVAVLAGGASVVVVRCLPPGGIFLFCGLAFSLWVKVPVRLFLSLSTPSTPRGG